MLKTLGDVPEGKRKAIEDAAKAVLSRKAWIPNLGPQADAFFCEADETFYGGQAGGGKTDLAVGLALTAHKRSLILRRINKDAVKIVSRVEEILGHRDGYNGQLQRWRLDERQLEFAGCEQESDKQRFKGDPHDLIVFDEGTDFLESQYRFIIGWNRSSDPAQRCRVLVTSNPPTTAEGLWVIRYWGPWLDPNHPRPAKPGELRWFTTIDGEDAEVDGPGPHMIAGEPIVARSRTFIPARLADNPDLASTNYGSVLASLPDELRRAYRDGDFSVGLKDAEFQVIPTKWIEAAQARWTPKPPGNVAMTAMGFDPAGGGADSAALAVRYGGWYGEIITRDGEETADGSRMAAVVLVHRRDACPVVVDMGGGFGGAVTQRMRDNGIAFTGFNGANKSTAQTVGAAKLSFYNKRAEAWWRFREALDPDQQGGSAVMLPPDAELRAELAAPTWELKPTGILVESKDEIRKRIGRSTNKADAVVMALSEGTAAAKRAASRSDMPATANLGYANLKRFTRRH